MNKNIFVSLAMFLVMAVSVFAVGDLNDPVATVTYCDVDATESIVFDITNSGTVPLLINHPSISGFTGASYNISSSAFSTNLTVPYELNASKSVEVSLTVDLRNANAMATSYSGFLNFISNSSASYAPASITVDVTDERPVVQVSSGNMVIVEGYSNAMNLTI